MKIFSKYLSLLVMALLPTLCFAALQEGTVQVGVVKGAVTVIGPNGEKKLLEPGMAIKEGDKVETDGEGSVELILSNGATLIVAKGSLVELRTFRQVGSTGTQVEGLKSQEPTASVTEFVVSRGEITGSAPNLNPMSSFVVKGPSGEASVRSGIFDVKTSVSSEGLASMQITCVKGVLQGTIYDSGIGSFAVAPGKVYSSAPPQVTSTPGTPANPTNSTFNEVYSSDASSAELNKIADFIDTNSGIRDQVVTSIREQAELVKDIVPTVDKVTAETPAKETEQKTTTETPTKFESTSSGGGADSTQKLLEQTQNPSGTGG